MVTQLPHSVSTVRRLFAAQRSTVNPDEAGLVRRIHGPLKQWTLSPMDLESRQRWEQYTKAKEVMLARAHIPEAPWWVVPADDKRTARLNCIHHLLSQMPYVEVEHPAVALPPRERNKYYAQQAVPQEIVVPAVQ